MSEKVLLKGSYPNILIDSKVAVVGSSATMIGRGYGEQIDKHAEVIRFNFAKISGYENDFGSRETIRLWTLTDRRLGQLFPEGKEKQMEKEIIECTRDVSILISSMHVAEIRANGEFYGRKDNAHGLKIPVDKFKEKHGLTLDKPARTGLLMLIALIESGIKPHVYGFSTGTKGVNHPAHYFRKGALVPTNGYHNVIQEEAIIQKMSDMELIVLYPCEVK